MYDLSSVSVYYFDVALCNRTSWIRRTAGLQKELPVCDDKLKIAKFFDFNSGRLQFKGWIFVVFHRAQCNNQWIYLFECCGNQKHMWRSIVWQMEKAANEKQLFGDQSFRCNLYKFSMFANFFLSEISSPLVCANFETFSYYAKRIECENEFSLC